MQHGRALECAAEIAQLSETPESANANAQKIRMSLSHMAGVLKPHFNSEDRILYPTLVKDTDPAVSGSAKRFWDELGGISATFNRFLDEWRSVNAIEGRSVEFIQACAALFPALKKRIESEESELYPLFLEQTGNQS